MANERLTLQIDGKATGTAEIEKLAAALGKVVEISSKARQPASAPAQTKTGFENFPQQIKQLVEDPVSSASGALKGLASSFGPVGMIATGVIGAIGSLAFISESAARNLADLGVSVRDVSLKTGFTTKEVGQFGFAARAVGQDVTIFEGGLRKLSQALADNGSEGDKAREVLTRLGVHTRELNGDLRPTSDIYQDIAAGLSKMGSSAERNAAIVKIFGRGGIELIPVLASLNEHVARAKELGIGLSEEDVSRMERYKSRLTEIDTAWAGIKRKLSEGIVGEITFNVLEVRNKIAGGVASASKAMGKFTSGQMLSDIGALNMRQGFAPYMNLTPDSDHSKADARYASVASGQSMISKDMTAFGGTLEGAQFQLTKLKQSAEEARTAFFGLKDQGVEKSVVAKAETEWKAAEAAAHNYEERVKLLTKAESQHLAIVERMRKLNEEGTSFYHFGSGALETVVSQDDLNKFNKPPNAPTLLRSGEGRNEDLFDKVQQGTTDFSAGLQYQGAHLVFVSPQSEREKFGDPQNASSEAYGKGLLEKQSRADQIHVDSLRAGFDIQARLIQLVNGPNGEYATAMKIADLRLDTADKEFLITGNILQLDQERVQVQKDRAEAALAEVERQHDREASFVTGLYRSAFGGGKSIANYAKEFVINTGETVISTYLRENPKLLDQLIPHAKEGSTAAKYLQGTLFGAKIDPGVTLNTAGASLQKSAIDLSAAATALGRGGSSGSAGGSAVGLLNGISGVAEAATGGGDALAGSFHQDGGTANDGLPISSTPNFTTPSYSSGSGAAATIGKIGATAGGLFAAYNGFSRGGGRGALEGVSGLTGAAAVWDPEPISKAVLAGVSLVSGFIGSVLPDPKQLRQQFIDKELGNAKYEAPTAMNITQDVSGGFSDVNAFGDVRKSNFSPYPSVTQSSQWYYKGQYYPVPGQTISPYGGPGQGQQVIQVHINGDVIDPQAFFDRNGTKIGNTIAAQFGTHTELANAATKATVVG